MVKEEKMKRVILAILGLTLAVSARANAYDDGDFQVWHSENQEKKINDKLKFTLEEEMRFGDDASEFYYQHYDGGLAYSVNKNFDIGLNYRQVYEKKVAHGKFKEENRPHMNATVKWEMFGFKLDDRSRLEYRHFDYQSDFWRYRNKITAKFPWKLTRLAIQPYLSDEFCLSFLGRALSRNRAYCGFALGLTDNLKGELFYMLQSDRARNGKWKATNVLGTKIKLAF